MDMRRSDINAFLIRNGCARFLYGELGLLADLVHNRFVRKLLGSSFLTSRI